MGYRQAKMLEDINGDLIPQYWDVAEQKFKPLTNDPQDVRLTGSNVETKRSTRTGTLAGSTTEILAESNSWCEIQSLFCVLQSDLTMYQQRFEFYLYDGRVFRQYRVLTSIDSDNHFLKDSDSLGFSDIFESSREGNYDVLRLRKPIKVRGFRAEVRNALTREAQIAGQVVWTEVV